MSKRGRAVIVDDDNDARETLMTVLRQAGFEVHGAFSGSEGVEAVREHNPEIVIMEVDLPDFDGIEASRRIRTFSDAYVIMVTGLTDEADTLMGFEAGADDVLAKPFRPRELRARIAAMFRRPRTMTSAADLKNTCKDANTGRSPAGPASPTDPAGPASPGRGTAQESFGPRTPRTGNPDRWDFEYKGLTLHEASRSAAINGVPVELTRTQFDLLLILVKNGRAVQSKTDLAQQLRKESYDTGSYVSTQEQRTLEVHLGYLRKKLGDNSRAPRWVETVRGVGYRMAL
ncbi:response regulator transcription factor [Pseudarthrobacter sp. NamE5]|nr:response regulator transcription factor [Pseudarthrobacter sp. NamE5]TLM83224.1 response regulator transcription factor [Pseudarthrobacter sp. NamE5]